MSAYFGSRRTISWMTLAQWTVRITTEKAAINELLRQVGVITKGHLQEEDMVLLYYLQDRGGGMNHSWNITQSDSYTR